MQNYVTETFVLNPPKFDFSKINEFKNEIIYVKKNENDYIPCLFIQDINQSNKFLIIFHGNNEHIFELEIAAGFIREELKMNVIVVEYPGYSIYISKKSPTMIMEDSIIVYDYIKEKFNIKDEDIFIYGRSIGSAPSIYLASQRNAKALFVISGFSSLKNVGKGLWVGWAIEDIFKNIENISKVNIPIFFIHGKNDSLISYEQTLELYNKCPSKIKAYKIIEKMTHNNYNLLDDIINNIKLFIVNNNIDIIRINQYYNLYNKKFDNMLMMPENISKYIDRMNFTLEGYTQFYKHFENVKFILLLKDDRIAIVYYNEINICDTLNFNKYYSIKSDKEIIFANILKNGNIIYCTNDAIVNIVQIELTNYKNIDQFQIDNFSLNKCKIIEIDNNNFMVYINSPLPLTKISKNVNSNQYEFKRIEAFNNKIINDIIYIENNTIATISDNILYLYNYLKDEHFSHILSNYNVKNQYNFSLINEYYLLIFWENHIYLYNIIDKQLFYKHIYIDSITRYCFFEGRKINPTFFLKSNQTYTIIGDKEGNIIKINFENDFIEQDEFIIIKTCQIFKFIAFPIKNILLINTHNLVIQSENNEIFIFIK